MSSLTLKIFLGGFLAGIGSFYFLPFLPFAWNFWGILAASLMFVLTRRSKKLWLHYAAVLLLAFLISGLRVNFDQHLPNSNTVDFYNGAIATQKIEGIICADPDFRPNQAKYIFCAETMSFGQNVRAVTGKILITARRYPDYQYGDKITVSGQLQTPSAEEKFNYKNYLSRYQIFSVMFYPQIDLLANDQGNRFLQKIFAWRAFCEAEIQQIFPEPASGLLAGLLIGLKQNLPDNVKSDFNLTGLSHIVAISGYNITIIITFILGILHFLPRRLSFIAALAGTVFFTLFVGAEASVVRAAMMGIIGLIALQKGRSAESLLAVLIAAFLMAGFNPKILWYDVGFQLSFLAVLGLIFIAPFFERVWAKIPTTLGLREALQMTLSAQIAVLPIILLNFERLPLISPLVNVLVAPFIPLAMLFGFIALIVSFFSFKLSLLIGFAAYFCLEIILKAASFSAGFAWASLPVTNFGPLAAVFYYAVLILGLWLWRRHCRQNQSCHSPKS